MADATPPGGSLSLSDSGEVAFVNEGGLWIASRNDPPELQQILATGQEFMGSTIRSVEFGTNAFSSGRELAFKVLLWDDRTVILLAKM